MPSQYWTEQFLQLKRKWQQFFLFFLPFRPHFFPAKINQIKAPKQLMFIPGGEDANCNTVCGYT
jgi:hypothetical protein